jgi:hypothetical protein
MMGAIFLAVMLTSPQVKTQFELLHSLTSTTSKASNRVCKEVDRKFNMLAALPCPQVFLSIMVAWVQVWQSVSRGRKVNSTINKRANSINLNKTL